MEIMIDEKIDRERYLTAIIDIQNHLLSVPTPDYGFIASCLGRVSGVSRTYFFENSIDASGSLLMSQRAEWCDTEAPPQIDNPDLQDLPYSIFPRIEAILSSNNIVNITRSDYTEEELEILDPQGVLAVLFLPVFVEKRFYGFFGFDNCREERQWSIAEAELLKSATLAVSMALEHSMARQRLADSEDRYRSVVHNIKNIVFQTDAEGNWTFLNHAWTEVTGFSLAESLGKPFLNYVHIEDRERNNKLFLPLIERKKESCRHTIRYITSSGSFKWIEVYARLTLDDSENIIGTSGLLTDVTEQIIAQNALHKSEERFRTLTSNIPGVVYRCAKDDAWSMQYISSHIENLSGYPAKEFMVESRSFADIIHPDDRALVAENVDQAVQQSLPFSMEYRINTSDGSEKWVYEKGQGVFDEEENLLWLDGVIFDITKKKLAEQQQEILLRKLQIAYNETQELEELRSELLAIVAHDINNPLTSILLTAELLRNSYDKLPKERIAYKMDTIITATSHIKEITNGILSSERVRDGKVKINPQPLSLSKKTRKAISNLQDWAAQKQITLHCNFTACDMIIADQLLIHEILDNLISNAIKYSPPGKSIFISTYSTDGQISCEVRDEGPGITPEDQKKLFQRFAKLSALPTAGETSIGLGLSITKKLVEMMNGNIYYKDEPGSGAIFVIEFPEFMSEQKLL